MNIRRYHIKQTLFANLRMKYDFTDGETNFNAEISRIESQYENYTDDIPQQAYQMLQEYEDAIGFEIIMADPEDEDDFRHLGMIYINIMTYFVIQLK